MKKLALFLSSLALTAAAWAGCGMGPGAACPPMAGPASALKVPVLFLTLVLGYWVLRHAEKETNTLLKYTGRTVAAIIFIGSLVGLLSCASCHQGPRKGMWEKRGGMCPFSAPKPEMETAPAPAPAVDAPEPQKKK